MTGEEPTDLIDAAFAAAQAEMTDALYNRENPHFKSKYADLSSVRHATIRALNKHGIGLTQRSEFDRERSEWVMITELRHKGQRLPPDVQPLFIQPGKPQANASERTYVRRGGWSSVCGIAVAGDDDDGNLASKNRTEMILPAELDELMDLAAKRKIDMPVFFDYAGQHLGYKIENLSMVKRTDKDKVRSFMTRKKEEKA